MQVYKFGGASVRDAASLRNVASILKSQVKEPTVVVVSAMGKTTNKLEQLVQAYFNKNGEAENLLSKLKQEHLSIAEELFGTAPDPVFDQLNNCFVELSWALEDEPREHYDYHYDQMVSQGEVLSSILLSAYLQRVGIANQWLDARELIQTDNRYREARVDYALSQSRVNEVLLPALKKSGLVITQGFIGGTSENFSSTLGREGSDYTAALIAYFTDAARVVIWKDVAGVLNADPKFFRNTKKFDELSYHDAIELTYYGATVIHPKTIKPLQNKNIPLYVKSFLDPSAAGTLISAAEKRVSVPSYIFKTQQILLSIQAKDFSFIAEENLSHIFELLAKHAVRANMMQNSAISFSLCVDHDPNKVEKLIEDMKAHYKVLYNDGVQLMTVRNYDQDTLLKLTQNKVILLEQRSRQTCQLVMKDVSAA